MLERNVLVLNRLWQAVNVCSARRAFMLLCSGQAQVVHTDDGHFLTHDFASWRDFSSREPSEEMVNTVSLKVRIPKVIVLLLFDRIPRKEVKFTRHNIYERDKNTCQYRHIMARLFDDEAYHGHGRDDFGWRRQDEA
jgi:5-methylcytosine-specific restriction endonuclease McrA